MIIYIAGKMAGNPQYEQEFALAAKRLKEADAVVINPAILPKGLSHDKYMPICMAMLDAADAIYLLENWEDSKGAQLEKAYAEYHKKIVLYEVLPQ